ncbi:hypothetical protein [Massilia orientalis]|uniref:Uncharacterized protein n=1 Tax=Massilia orientalis TaxID=3050128 RepID=A0ACC7MEF0_9BURK|nr:hypothetical protein [Massilia sp. YIM B02787]
MDWRNAGFRTKIGKIDGSVIFPLLLAIVVFHYVTIFFLVLYAGVSMYMSFRGRSMKWLWRRLRFWLRRGVILARTQRYWRYVRTGHY